MPWVKGQSGNPAGKPKGRRNAKAVALEEAARAKGITPIQVMLETVELLVKNARAEKEPAPKAELMERASDIAAKVAPYLHPRLQAIEHTGAGGGPMQIDVRHVPDAVAERILAATGIDVRQSPEETRH